ncbi:polysaccharide deacetylase family protein [Dongia sp.]|uniref:polysaccharide deacetylase family protein n=1 Tax=Dongia sp. TaxID=1977262 RepID=UPI0035B19337
MVELAADWDQLAREIDLWEAAGSEPSLWWRDDDAVADSPALRELRRVAGVPLALAVIPLAPDRPLQNSLAVALADWPAAIVLQHGIQHRNAAAPSAKKSEFPADRAMAEIDSGLAAARAHLQQSFGAQFIPVLTPPWNRIAAAFLPVLARQGYRGISRFAEPPYQNPTPIKGLLEVNTQVDVIDWRGSRGFAGESACLGRLVAHLAARRAGATDPLKPTGILTHHLVHDAATWRFLENLQDWLARRRKLHIFSSPAAIWSPG